jgi:excisionase family DNA binding protein
VKVKAIPASTLTAIAALLSPYAPDASPTAIVEALQGHDRKPVAADPAARRMLSLKEAGRAVGISEWTIRRMILDGRVQGRKVGSQWRVPLAAIEALAGANAVEA